MKKLSIVIAVAMLTFSVAAGAQTLDELAEIVRRAATTEGQINQDREARFLRERDNQRNLLAQARAEKKREEKRSDDLKTAYDHLERELAELATVLQERMGNLGELFGIVRQASGDIQAALNDRGW
jgi:biopolymer transport protein ExbB